MANSTAPDNDDLPSDQDAPQAQPSQRARDPKTGRYLPPNQPQAQPPQAQVQEPVEQPAGPSPLQSLALRMGIKEHTVKTLSPEALQAVVSDVYEMQQSNQQVQRQQPQQRQPEPVAPVPEPIDWGVDVDGKPLTEKDYAPHQAKVIRAAHRIDQIEKRQQALEEQHNQSRQLTLQQQIASRFDAAFAKYPDVFGQGSTDSLDPFSDESIKRERVMRQCNAAQASGRGTGDPYQDALNLIVTSGMIPLGVKPRIPESAWNTAQLAPPNNKRSTVNLSEREQRIAELEARQRDAGIYVPHDSVDDKSDLPGWDEQ